MDTQQFDLEVRQHNALTNARYEYSEAQANLFLVLLSKLRKGGPDDVYQITVSEMEKRTGNKYNYKQLRESTREMVSRAHEIETFHKGKPVLRQLVLFSRIDYILGTGVIELEINKYATQYLFEIKNNFTSFQLQAALNLTSKHAKRIYQFCSQWKDIGETKKYAILDFKKILGLADDKGKEEYVLISMFKQKVLDLAVKQINEKTDLNISYQLEKIGRSFKNIVFTVKNQPQAIDVPFEVLSSEVATATGLALHQVENARRLLVQLNISTPDLVATILGNATHVTACNKFAHELKTGKHVKAHSLSGLLLTILGIKKARSGPNVDKPAKTP